MKAFHTFSLTLVLGLAGVSAQAGDYSGYVQKAEAAAGRALAITQETVPHEIEVQRALLAQGRQHVLEFAAEYPEFADLMQFVADSANDMTAMTLEEIEMAWHEGGALEAMDMMNTTEDHFGVLNSVVDMMVHPATGIIALEQFAQTGDAVLLERLHEEMSEVVDHVSQL